MQSDDALALKSALVTALDVAVSNGGTCLIAFHRDAPPDVLHHSMQPAAAQHYLDRYLAGPYLLDPLFQLAVQTEQASVCRFRDATPDRFRSSEYYRQYYERTHLRDEMDFLLRVDKGSTLVLVVGRLKRRFSKIEVERLQLIEQVVYAAMRKIWQQSAGSERNQRSMSMHRRLRQCFDNFGEASLTEREREITQLLLRGHSAKSIARELRIAPGTVMVHKRNLFSKLGITSQYELFSLFIRELSRTSRR